MTWSLGLLPPNEPILLDEFLLALGKCLYLASAFERKCRWMLGLLELRERLKVTDGLDAALELVNALKREMLGPSIGKLKKLLPILEDDVVEILQRAKDARNYIAHEGAGEQALYYASAGDIQSHLEDLRRELAALIAGDSIVSAWLYEVEEKMPAPPTIIAAYPRLIEEWVFGRSSE
jgi:hypothetical protein